MHRPVLATFLVTLAAALSTAPTARAALGPDQLVLIVNAKVPASRQLAELYAKERKVSPGRILALDLPYPQEGMAADIYDAQVVPKVRAFLEQNQLKDKATCLVTFYGVPLRVERRVNTPDQNAEVAERDRGLNRVVQEIATTVASLEARAAALDPRFRPKAGQKLEELLPRAEAAAGAIRARLAGVADVAERKAAAQALLDAVTTLAGQPKGIQEASRPELAATLGQPAAEDVQRAKDALAAASRELTAAQRNAGTRAGRDRAIELVRKHLGLIGTAQAMQALRGGVDNRESEAAFDSELSLLWVDNYPRPRWVPNLLHHAAVAAAAAQRQPRPRLLMVMRIDAPTVAVAKRLILDSIAVEREGLSGLVALDARGNRGNNGYGQYDQTIRNLADLLKAKTKLDVRLDDTEALFAPASLKDVALYCGWYRLRNYEPAFTFKRGAVGFHVASSELVSLRGANEKGWVANLLNDGVASSLGPVAEPYLHAFPRADEFFPLLMTGRLTLAEVYWATNPLSSWMNTCIGDPLYTPFKANPPLKADDLPPQLRKALGEDAGAATPPAPAPAPGHITPPAPPK